MTSVSIIIPTYNRADCIACALDSLAAQHFHDMEVIVVDDGSTDQTRQLIKRYSKQSKLCLRYHYQTRSGTGAARNAGINSARGRYIALLDADDILLNNSIKHRYALLESEKSLDLVFSDYDIDYGQDRFETSRLAASGFIAMMVDHTDNLQGENIALSKSWFKCYLDFSPYPIWTGTVMFRKEVIGRAGLFREDLRVGEDLEYWLRILQHHQVGYINKSLARYNNYRGTIMREAKRAAKDNLVMLRSLRQTYLNTPIQPRIQARIEEALQELQRLGSNSS